MPVKPDQFARIALKRAQSADVARLFEQLAERAEILAGVQDEFLQSVTRRRATREGRPVRLSKRQQQSLAAFERDAEQGVRAMERYAASMDDAQLLASALGGAEQAVQLDEWMLPSLHADDKSMAMRLLEYQRETMRLIEEFVASSPFRGTVTSIWRGRSITQSPSHQSNSEGK